MGRWQEMATTVQKITFYLSDGTMRDISEGQIMRVEAPISRAFGHEASDTSLKTIVTIEADGMIDWLERGPIKRD